jgi:predicted RNA binding protein YcfA (HicA-like mRNA interferase family)
MNGYHDQVARLLKKAGFSYVRNGKGSHEIYSNGRHTTTVLFNLLSRILANAILKKAGVKERV